MSPAAETSSRFCTRERCSVIATTRFFRRSLILKKADAGISRVLQLRFVGEGMEDLAREAARLGRRRPGRHRRASRHGRRDSIAACSRMSCLFLGRPPAMNGHELFTSAKVFAYLKARRPVAAVLPRDGSRRVLTRVGVSTIADVDSPQAIASMFRGADCCLVVRNSRHSSYPIESSARVIPQKRQTEALSRCLDGAPAESPSSPARVDVAPSLTATTLQRRGGPAWSQVDLSVPRPTLTREMKIAFVEDGIYAYASRSPLAVGGAERAQWLLARTLGCSRLVGERRRTRSTRRRR